MIEFSSSITIAKPPEEVFNFLANIDRVEQAQDSPVLALDATTPGPPAPGSKYREVVRILPFYHGEFISVITSFEPSRLLEMNFTGPAMTGRDRYELTETLGGTELVHKKWVSFPGLLRIMEPLMRRPLFPRLQARLEAIKQHLEEGKGAPAQVGS